MSDHTPTPLILDTTVLGELARGDIDTIGLVQSFDAQRQPMVVSALAITWTVLDCQTEESIDAMHGLALLDEVTVAPLKDAPQATSLAGIMTVTGLDAWNAHVAGLANVAVCPILTRNSARWQQASEALAEPLYLIEISDPGDHS